MGAEFCKKAHSDKVLDETVLVSDGKLKNVLVYIKKGLKGKFTPPSEPVVLDQKGCIFKPHVVALMAGQKLQILNSDDTLYNVHILALINREENFGQPENGQKAERTFRAEIGVQIKCDVHPWMKSFLHVLRHPYFEITGTDGAFTLSDVPPGDYVLEARHEKYGRKSVNVTVSAGKKSTVQFTYSSVASRSRGDRRTSVGSYKESRSIWRNDNAWPRSRLSKKQTPLQR